MGNSSSGLGGKSVLLASYGGGHANIIVSVARALIARGADVRLIGFTTARAVFERAGLPAQSVAALLEDDDAQYVDLARDLVPEDGHPDVTEEETVAYHAIGLRDLIDAHGEQEALRRFEQDGRKSFYPEAAMRRFLERTRPDAVVGTTAPRFELALLRAARSLDIPSLAIADTFLVNEVEWVTAPGYAHHLCVLSDFLERKLAAAGVSGTKIHVTGNPAFDQFFRDISDQPRRDRLRHEEGYEGKRLILWPTPAGPTVLAGIKTVELSDVVDFLGQYCAAREGTEFMIRPHPNYPIQALDLPETGAMCPAHWSVEDSLLACDHVLVEMSTVGMLAAFAGIPVTCVGYGEVVEYPAMGIADAVPDLASSAASLDDFKASGEAEVPRQGAENVVRVLSDVLGRI